MPELIIVGASVRAAAASAIRAGLSPWCADLFADADLREMVPASTRCPLESYPRAFLELLRDAPAVPWMYTGALENHPELIRKMAALRSIWGNGPDALRACRSPFNVGRILRDAGLPALELRRGDESLPRDGRWLRKPLGSSAGQGIEFASASTRPSSSVYFQQFVEGTPMSACFVRSGAVKLLGVTEQLIGELWLNAPSFQYAGNIGPVEISAPLQHDLLNAGTSIGNACGLVGLFGIDFVLAAGRPWVVEVNPRYTASMEVLELATGANLIAEHARAFGNDAPAIRGKEWGPIVGKAILYADTACVFRGLPQSNEATVRVADVPDVGSTIEAGWPVLSILARASDVQVVRQILIEQAGRIHAFQKS